MRAKSSCFARFFCLFARLKIECGWTHKNARLRFSNSDVGRARHHFSVGSVRRVKCFAAKFPNACASFYTAGY